ncbi:MAG: hypothetical protein U0X20_17225 [Caldilineaceae bacterium]
MNDQTPNGTPADGASTPKPSGVILLVGTPEFDAYLSGFTEYHAARAREKEQRNQWLQLVGEIVEVAADCNMALSPSDILVIAETAKGDILAGGDLSDASAQIIFDLSKPRKDTSQ